MGGWETRSALALTTAPASTTLERVWRTKPPAGYCQEPPIWIEPPPLRPDASSKAPLRITTLSPRSSILPPIPLASGVAWMVPATLIVPPGAVLTLMLGDSSEAPVLTSRLPPWVICRVAVILPVTSICPLAPTSELIEGA